MHTCMQACTHTPPRVGLGAQCGTLYHSILFQSAPYHTSEIKFTTFKETSTQTRHPCTLFHIMLCEVGVTERGIFAPQFKQWA